MDRHATAVWQGNLKEGKGALETQSGALAGLPYSFKTRFEDEGGKSGTNPEELIAAAHAGCYAMQFSHFLAENGTPATKIDAPPRSSIANALSGSETRRRSPSRTPSTRRTEPPRPDRSRLTAIT